ncbi:NUDIX domain-containing protein [Kitasatospora sp. NPDC057904]|uniref:NUDIX domain-containing protein n=1 Tax=Kitasatospora sp. NPDC057904 TaxID=3346275 RepID=UPI0036DA2BB4
MPGPRLHAEVPVCRLGCLVLVRNVRGDVLLVDPDHLDGLILPGGAARPDEAPHEAAARHLFAQTGLVRRLTHVLALDFACADRYPQRLGLVFDGGVTGGRPAGARFVPVRRIGQVMAPAQAARVTEALTGRAVPLLLHGQRAA